MGCQLSQGSGPGRRQWAAGTVEGPDPDLVWTRACQVCWVPGRQCRPGHMQSLVVTEMTHRELSIPRELGRVSVLKSVIARSWPCFP